MFLRSCPSSSPSPSTSYAASSVCLGACRQLKIPVGSHSGSQYTARNVSSAANASAGAGSFDVCLSSGFLAFANHSGFLAAIEDAGIKVSGIMGTSAGALAGSLYSAGYTPRQVAAELSRDPPLCLLRPSTAPWQGGLLSLDPVVERLRGLLPPTFEELEREFAVGVVDAQGRHVLIDSGPLPEAVAASAAIPYLFESVFIPGGGSRKELFKDGGVVDRIGLKAWRDRRRMQHAAAFGKQQGSGRLPTCLVHVIQRSSPFSGNDDIGSCGEGNIAVFKSPKSGVNLLSLGNFEDDLRKSAQRAKPGLEALLLSGHGVMPGPAGVGQIASQGSKAPSENKKHLAARRAS